MSEVLVTECALCYRVRPCFLDGEAYICIDGVQCKERQDIDRVHRLFMQKLAAAFPDHPWLKRSERAEEDEGRRCEK